MIVSRRALVTGRADTATLLGPFVSAVHANNNLAAAAYWSRVLDDGGQRKWWPLMRPMPQPRPMHPGLAGYGNRFRSVNNAGTTISLGMQLAQWQRVLDVSRMDFSISPNCWLCP
jgi:hypothetical protein